MRAMEEVMVGPNREPKKMNVNEAEESMTYLSTRIIVDGHDNY